MKIREIDDYGYYIAAIEPEFAEALAKWIEDEQPIVDYAGRRVVIKRMLDYPVDYTPYIEYEIMAGGPITVWTQGGPYDEWDGITSLHSVYWSKEQIASIEALERRYWREHNDDPDDDVRDTHDAARFATRSF